MHLERWRPLTAYLDGHRPELTRLLQYEAGIYLLARPARTGVVTARDIVYIGQAGASVEAKGTFRQRIRSHGAKLLSGPVGNPGCPTAWAEYFQALGGVDARPAHVLRLIRMPASTEAEKAEISRWEQLLLALWRPIADDTRVEMPRLNAAQPRLDQVRQIFEGPIEERLSAHIAVPTAPIELNDIWPSGDEALDQAEKLARYTGFFERRGQTASWDAMQRAASAEGYALIVVDLHVARDRPGQLRLARIAPDAKRASSVLALITPDLADDKVAVELRILPAELPPPFSERAQPSRNGKMRSKLSVKMAEVPAVLAFAMRQTRDH